MAQAQRQSVLFHLLDVALNVIVIVAIVAGVRTFLVSPFQVEGSSMTSTLEDREYIIINKLAYFIGQPERGDVVVFRPPSDMTKYYVKRVIGVPGDSITIKNGYVYVQPAGAKTATKIDEPYLDDRNQGHTFAKPGSDEQEAHFQVPAGNYFLLGDNRQGSLDSRSFVDADKNPIPYVPQSDIKGRVWFVALPLSKIEEIVPAHYNIAMN